MGKQSFMVSASEISDNIQNTIEVNVTVFVLLKDVKITLKEFNSNMSHQK